MPDRRDAIREAAAVFIQNTPDNFIVEFTPQQFCNNIFGIIAVTFPVKIDNKYFVLLNWKYPQHKINDS
jgi:hypothetical protein